MTYTISGNTIAELNTACMEWLAAQGIVPGATNTPPPPAAPKSPQRPAPARETTPAPAHASRPDSGTISKNDLIRIITRITKQCGAGKAQDLMRDNTGRIRGLDAIPQEDYAGIYHAAEALL